VCVQPVRHVAERVRPPRALLVPFELGYPLGTPGDAEAQHTVLDQMLRILEDDSLTSPVLSELARDGAAAVR